MAGLKQQILARAGRFVAPLGAKRQPTRDIYLAMAELARRRRDGASEEQNLTPHELRVFSQNGEDGVLCEILNRIGEGSRTFVEFGTEAGYEANCVYLADVLGWSGFFIEGAVEPHRLLEAKYRHRPTVVTHNAFLTPENIEAEFAAIGVPAEPDILSIDVDGGDYWLWNALEQCTPRVIVIEYNSVLGPHVELVQPCGLVDTELRAEFGASIGALVKLARTKGYRLVHCELTGVNAFFVRDGLPGPWPDDVVHRTPNYDFAGHHHPRSHTLAWNYDEV